MKNKIILLSVLSLNAFASEKEVHNALMRWHNIQGLVILCSMAVVGVNGLVQNADKICSDDPFCWKVTVPALTMPLVIGGSLLYKRLNVDRKRIV